MCLAAAERLRSGFGPDPPIFARAQTRLQAQALKTAGATEVIVEFDELPRSAPVLLFGRAALPASPAGLGFSASDLTTLLELYASLDADASGTVNADDVRAMLAKSNAGLTSDAELRVLERRLDSWLASADPSLSTRISFYEFCRLWRVLRPPAGGTGEQAADDVSS